MSDSSDSQQPGADRPGAEPSDSSARPDGPPPPNPGIRYGLDDEPGTPPSGYGPDDEQGTPPPPRPGPGLGWPAPGGPPPGGYTVPGATPMGGPVPPPDPLAGRRDGGFEDWVRRTVAVCRRSGGPALAIVAVVTMIPGIATAIVSAIMAPRLQAVTPIDADASPADIMHVYAVLGGYFAVLLPVVVLAGYLTSAGWCATLRIMAHDAAGAPRDVGAAVRYGLRRGVALWGWYLLAALCCMVGLVACIVPGVYLALAMSMIAPVTVFERGRPAISGSFRLMHAHFWPAVGRLVVLGLALFGYLLLVNCVLGAAFGTGGLTVDTASTVQLSTTRTVVESLVQSLFGVPATVVGIAGILAAYAEQRARLQPLTSGDLARAAD